MKEYKSLMKHIIDIPKQPHQIGTDTSKKEIIDHKQTHVDDDADREDEGKGAEDDFGFCIENMFSKLDHIQIQISLDYNSNCYQLKAYHRE